MVDLLASSNYIIFNKTIAKRIGIENAILLGALCSYQAQFKHEEFYKEQFNIIEDTGLSEYLVRKSTKELVNIGLLQIRKKGLPAKYYYYIDETILLNFILQSSNISSSSGVKIDTTSGVKIDTTSNIKSETSNNNNIMTNNKTNKENILKEMFDEFWQEYPKKMAKPVAYKSFIKIKNLNEIFSKIIEDVKKRKNSKEWKDKQFIPYPATYLNQERWNDVIENTNEPDWLEDYVANFEKGVVDL